jgi:hypothetical protein
MIISCVNEKNQNKTNGDTSLNKTENVLNINKEDFEIVETFDIFEKNMFINISPDPEFYRNNNEFTFNELFLDNSIGKGIPQKRIIVKNDEVEIEYYPDDYSINGIYIIQFVTLKTKNDKYFLGDFFGKTPKEVVKTITNIPDYWSGKVGNFYGWPEEEIFKVVMDVPVNWSGEISYHSEGFYYFVNLSFKNGIVNGIKYGQSI